MHWISGVAPYGEPYAQSGAITPSFAGQDQNLVKTGPYALYDAMFRHYNPVWGRWLSPDPAGMAAANPADPQSWNRYAYVENNPMTHIDPKGLYLRSPGSTWWDDGCTMDGTPYSCAEAAWVAAGGGAVVCPENMCTGEVDGVLVHYVAFENGATYAPDAGPGSWFSSDDQAIIAGALYAEYESLLNDGNEQCGMTYDIAGSYSYTAPVEGTVANCEPQRAWGFLLGGTYTGAYHSHGEYNPGYYQERFSGQPGDQPGDVQWGNGYQFPFGLATPGGNVMVYYPGPGCQTFFLGSPLGTGTTIPICP